ncbi:MAG: hypothetical protein PVH68_03045 [Armatimonadota bacterium]
MTCTLAAVLASLPAIPAAAAAPEPGGDPAPLLPSPHRIGFESEGLGLTVADVAIAAPKVYDYTFTGAPTDWVPRGGTWVMQARWTCSPQWSWYGGYGDAIAALWNKRVFEGDVSVDMYAAFKMGLGAFSGYKNPNDMNITLLGDGANPDSGYSFIVGGGLNMYTRIMKGHAVLAETREKPSLLPVFEDGDFSTTEFHRRWWMVKAQRIGDVLSLYMDNQLVLQARDPDPIPAGRVGIWTHDNGIMLARVRISYERETTTTEPAPMFPYLSAGDLPLQRAPLLVTSPTHPGGFSDFESGVGQFAMRSGADGAALAIVEGGLNGRGHALRLVNINAGGDFGATALNQPLLVGRGGARYSDASGSERIAPPGAKYRDAKGVEHIAPHGVKHIDFDYKVTPDVRVNLFARVEGGLYEIVFTGLDEPSYMAQILGTIEDVEADDRWHHAHFDLWGHLRRVFGDSEPLTLDDLFFANRSTSNYLTAGFGGNHAGATWYLDNFCIGTAGPPEVELSWQPGRARVGPAPPVGYATALDQHPHTVPAAENTAPEPELTAEGLSAGTHFCHIRAQHADGSWGPAVHHKIVVDAAPPTVAALRPEPGSKSDATDIGIELADRAGVGVDPQSLILAVNGAEHKLGDGALRYDAVTGRLRLDPSKAGLTLADGDSVELELRAGSDYLGNTIARLPKWTFTVSQEADRSPPPPPTVTAATPYLCNNTFEHDMGEWANYGSTKGAIVYRDPSTAAGGKYSLRLYNRSNGGLFGAYICKTAFDAGKHRIVSFDYRINDRIRADFAVYVNGKWCKIVFTDNDNTFQKIGEVPGVVRDNQWHHTEFNLYDMLSAADPEATGYVVRHFIVGDWGTMANTQHATYWIDNFRIMPIVAASDEVRFTWQSSDPIGILGGSWVLDRQPDTVPPERISGEGAELSFAEPTHGDAYLHVRAADKAGNWSPTAHYRVLMDGIAPSVGQHEPADGVREARSQIKIPLSDEGGAGIDPGSVVLTVAGSKYGITNPGLTYDATSKALVWDGQQVAPKPVVFADGQQVAVALESAADYAGNAVARMPSWTWTMDHSKDTAPPIVDQITCGTHPTAVTNTFEHDLGAWAPGPGATRTTKVERDSTAAATGRFSAKITHVRGALRALAHDTDFQALRHPWVSFDYRVPPGMEVDMRLLVGGTWHVIAFTGSPASKGAAVPNVQADGRWHHASFNVTTYLRQQRRGRSSLTVEQIVFADQPEYENQPGASFNIDNFIVGAPGKAAPSLSWKATDATGITDYSYELDDQPGTVPDEVGEGPSPGKRYGALRKGLYFFHIRARDGAGRWGPTRHYAIMHLEPPPTTT